MSISVTCCGAAGEVTGSAYLVQAPRARVLVDFGFFQGRRDADVVNATLGPVDPHELDAVVATHAHLDHIGRLPILAAAGYRGPVFATPATLDLMQIMLEDATKVQEQDAARENQRRARAGLPAIKPLYGKDEIALLEPLCKPLAFETPSEIAPGISVRLFESGHILGAASVEMRIKGDGGGSGGGEKVIVFSGDIGPRDTPILRDPVLPGRADLVFLESTYGNRDHRPLAQTVDEFNEILKAAEGDRRRVLVPAFAVGRTQQIMYHLAQAVREGVIGDFRVYLDSPLAFRASMAYSRHRGLYDRESAAMVASGQMERDLRQVRVLETPQQSKALNGTSESCMIVAGSGMCDGGRIVHHLKHGLWRRDVSVILPGFMAQGTLGRKLAEGARQVEIDRDRVAVNARIHTLGGFSAHAGQTELVEWLAGAAGGDGRMRIALTHGEDPQRQALAAKLRQRYGAQAMLPVLGETIRV